MQPKTRRHDHKGLRQNEMYTFPNLGGREEGQHSKKAYQESSEILQQRAVLKGRVILHGGAIEDKEPSQEGGGPGGKTDAGCPWWWGAGRGCMAGDGSSSLYRRARPSITQWSARRPPPAACPPRPPAYTASAPLHPGRSETTHRVDPLLHTLSHTHSFLEPLYHILPFHFL